MHSTDGEEGISFIGRPAPDWLAVRRVTIPGHGEMAYEPSEWAGALVIVEAGEIELECVRGECARFRAGAVLVFEGLRLRAVRNRSTEPALLSAASRRHQARVIDDPASTDLIPREQGSKQP
jgi:hypothetical protein